MRLRNFALFALMLITFVIIPFDVLAQAADAATAPVVAAPSSPSLSIFATLYALVQPLIGMALLALSGWLTVWLNGKIKNEKAAAVVVRGKDLIFALVKKANQTIVDGLKAANADGVITDAEKKQIKAGVIADFKSMVGVNGLAAIAYAAGLTDSAGALDAWLDTQIEAAVHDVKLLKASVEKPTGFR